MQTVDKIKHNTRRHIDIRYRRKQDKAWDNAPATRQRACLDQASWIFFLHRKPVLLYVPALDEHWVEGLCQRIVLEEITSIWDGLGLGGRYFILVPENLSDSCSILDFGWAFSFSIVSFSAWKLNISFQDNIHWLLSAGTVKAKLLSPFSIIALKVNITLSLWSQTNTWKDLPGEY